MTDKDFLDNFTETDKDFLKSKFIKTENESKQITMMKMLVDMLRAHKDDIELISAHYYHSGLITLVKFSGGKEYTLIVREGL